jgi:itaconyl-CoA hydratase
VQTFETSGPGRYRESFGRYYEDFGVGDVYEHRPGRTITQQDNIWFTLLTMNTHPLHFDEEYASRSEFGRTILTHPVYPGDTLYAESEVIETRESKSRPQAGIVSVQTTGRNQDGTVVCTFERTMLIPKRGAGVEE